VAGGYVFAEEREAGTDVFLSRLPVSQARITAEKLAAGLAVLTILWLIHAALHVIALPFGGLWSGEPSPVGIIEEAMSWITSPTTVAGTLVVFSFGSYLVGVLVSLVTKQPLVVVVVGYAIESIIYGFIMMGVDDALWVTWDMAWLNLVVYVPLMLVPLLVAAPGSRFRIPGAVTLLSPGRAPVGGLVWKSITENSTLQMLSLVFLLGEFIVPSGIDPALVIGGALLLLVALGTASYSPVEKQGLDCLLYQHPVPRNQLFWAKTGAAVVPILAVAAGTLVSWSRLMPPDIATVLAYSCFAYSCAVLMTLTLERPVIALLAAVSLVVMSLLIPILLIEFMANVANLDLADLDITVDGISVLIRQSGVPVAEWPVVFLGLAIPAILMAAGSLWIAWRMANSPAVLTETPAYRFSFVARNYTLLLAVSYAVTLLSWRERLALIW